MDTRERNEWTTSFRNWTTSALFYEGEMAQSMANTVIDYLSSLRWKGLFSAEWKDLYEECATIFAPAAHLATRALRKPEDDLLRFAEKWSRGEFAISLERCGGEFAITLKRDGVAVTTTAITRGLNKISYDNVARPLKLAAQIGWHPETVDAGHLMRAQWFRVQGQTIGLGHVASLL